MLSPFQTPDEPIKRDEASSLLADDIASGSEVLEDATDSKDTTEFNAETE